MASANEVSKLPFRPNSYGGSGCESWQPVKDLLRTLMRREISGQAPGPRDEPRVNVPPDIPNGRFGPYATVSFKEEAIAKKMFALLAGNSWHGSILRVLWLKICPNFSQQLLADEYYKPCPAALEKISPIKNSKLLRPQSLQTPNRNLAPRGQVTLASTPVNSRPPFSQDGPCQLVGNMASAPALATAVLAAPSPQVLAYGPTAYTVGANVHTPPTCDLDQHHLVQIQQAVRYHMANDGTLYWPAHTPGTVPPYANMAPPPSTISHQRPNQMLNTAPSDHQGPLDLLPMMQALPLAPGAARCSRSSTTTPTATATPDFAPGSRPQPRQANKPGSRPAKRQAPQERKGDSGPVIANGSDEGPA